MTDAEMDDLYELYILGVLEPEVAAEVEGYIREHPGEASARLKEATEIAAAMAGMAEEVKPPAELRQRVLATVTPRRHSRNWMFAFGGLAAACVVLAVFSLSTRSELQQARNQLQSVGNSKVAQQAQVAALTNERDQLRTELANTTRTQQTQVAALSSERDQLRTAVANANGTARAAQAADATNRAQVSALIGQRDQLRSTLEATNNTNEAQISALKREVSELRTALAKANSAAQVQMAALTGEVNQLQSAFEIMRRPDTRSARFGTPEAAHGWVFSSSRGGLVLVGSRLPSVPDDRTLELWLVPTSGAPRPAGVFRASDAAGDAIHISALAVDPSQIKAVAVSEEPRAGSSAPTTKPFLLVPLT